MLCEADLIYFIDAIAKMYDVSICHITESSENVVDISWVGCPDGSITDRQ
jgi:hypothetical protein